MIAKFITLLLCILFYTNNIFSQSALDNTSATNIDTLIYYFKFEQAQIKIQEALQEILHTEPSAQRDKEMANLYIKGSNIAELSSQYDTATALALKVLDLPDHGNIMGEKFYAYLQIALSYEIIKDFTNTKVYLDKALALHTNYQLDSIYSKYCIRLASYYRFMEEQDSALWYAESGLQYALKYENKREILDGNLLLGILLSKYNHIRAIKYTFNAAQEYMHQNNYRKAQIMYNNISMTYLHHQEFAQALDYNYKAFELGKNYNLPENAFLYRNKQMIFDSLKQIDSAYHALKKYHQLAIAENNALKDANIVSIIEEYENDKKNTIIKRQGQQLLFIVILAGLSVAVIMLLIKKNKKISAQNKIIDKQVIALKEQLHSKQLILAELQHRVKNNLQHIIAILELQKESINYHNIEELIRCNQNRIYSIALLHKKIDMLENVQEVNFKKYILELSELVVDSYQQLHKNICINIHAQVEYLSIEKAMPLGLILIELISNSIKHAFKGVEQPSIDINFSSSSLLKPYTIHYKDNGKGFDFLTQKSRGLGLEIIKGFIHQLNASIETNAKEGFQIIIYF